MASILIAEDDVHMIRILAIWLQRNGHEVVEAANGLIAKEHLQRRSFDFLISDVNMPQLDGVGLIHWLRTEHRSDIPAILLSSRCDQLAIAEDLSSFGVKIHPKPFSPSRIVAQIEERLRAGGSAKERGSERSGAPAGAPPIGK